MHEFATKLLIRLLCVGALLLGLSGVAQAKDLKNDDLSAEHGALATQIGDVPTNVEMTTQHGIITDDIAAALAALQADIAALQGTVEALPAGAGPCEVPPVWGKKFAGADRFVAVLDGAAYCDQETGLVWEGSPDITGGPNGNGTRTWNSAISHCANLEVDDRKGWALPMREQLATLVDTTSSTCTGGAGSICLPDVHPFSGVQSAGYWSATSNLGSPTFAWLIDFFNGDVNDGFKDNDNTLNVAAWCVRGGQSFDGNTHDRLQ